MTMIWDTIVIGAGIEGSAAAYDLAKRGRKTLLLEQVFVNYIKLINLSVIKIFAPLVYVYKLISAFIANYIAKTLKLKDLCCANVL